MTKTTSYIANKRTRILEEMIPGAWYTTKEIKFQSKKLGLFGNEEGQFQDDDDFYIFLGLAVGNHQLITKRNNGKLVLAVPTAQM